MTKPGLYGPRAWIEGPWPYRPAPQNDELASSFLARTAQGLGLMPITFLNALFGSSRSLLNQDLDAYIPTEVLDLLVLGSGLTRERFNEMTLADTVGHLNLSHIPRARKTWILPTTVCSNERRRAGLQYCPTCLSEDVRPYVRRLWRLGFITICSRHKINLLDRCPHCEAVVHVHRSPSLRHCFQCGLSLCTTSAVQAATKESCRRQAQYEQILKDGYAVMGGRAVYSPLYFIVLRRACGLVVNGKRAEQTRDAIVRRYGGDRTEFHREHKRHPLEYLSVADRERMLDLADRFLADYPKRFIETCDEVRLTRSRVIRDMNYVPFVLDVVLREHLDDAPYHASESEVVAAADWLRRTRGLATYRELKAHCGESRDAIYKHMDYERSPTRPSRRRQACSSIDSNRATLDKATSYAVPYR